jgi:tellurite resistance protein
VADILWLTTAAAWLLTVAHHLLGPGGPAGVARDLRHPVFGPFAALVPTVVSLVGARVVDLDATTGRWLVGAALVATTLHAAWFQAELLRGGRRVDDLHPGYLLPSVAAVLLAGQSCAVAGWRQVGLACFAAGILCWLFIGTLLVGRLAFGPPLPAAIVPTLAIFSAPPAVAGNAWFTLNGGRVDPVAVALLGTFVPLMLLQVLLVPAYVRSAFTLGFWAVTFTAAASSSYALRWLALERPAGWPVAAWATVAAGTVVVGGVAVRSVLLVARTPRPVRSTAGDRAVLTATRSPAD